MALAVCEGVAVGLEVPLGVDVGLLDVLGEDVGVGTNKGVAGELGEMLGVAVEDGEPLGVAGRLGVALGDTGEKTPPAYTVTFEKRSVPVDDSAPEIPVVPEAYSSAQKLLLLSAALPTAQELYKSGAAAVVMALGIAYAPP